MIILTLWQWWYRHGWQSAASALLQFLKAILQNFSVPVLVRTLFAPWKRTVNVAGPNTPIQVRLQWWIGNQVSRFIGFIIRAFVLMVALLMLLVGAIGGGLLLLAWPLAPVATILAIVMAVVRIWM